MIPTTPPPGTVLLAGATGDLGGRILRNLLARGATVRVLTRPETGTARIAPMILNSWHRVLFWSDPDQVLDFTTKDDTAAYTAAAALDRRAPRVLQTAGDQVTARTLASTMTDLTGTQFRLLHGGSVGSLAAMSRTVKALMPASDEPFPPWQGMQYFASMFGGDAKLQYINNDRYGSRIWTTARDVLERHCRDN